MHRSLSAFLRNAAENASDGKIPADVLSFIHRVQSAERAMERSTDPAERLMDGIAGTVRELDREVDRYNRASRDLAFQVRLASQCHDSKNAAGQAQAEHQASIHREQRCRSEADIVALTEQLEDLCTKLRLHVRPLSVGGRAA